MRASKSIRAGSTVYGVRSAASVKEANIGVAAASNWLRGVRPRISSIVRIMLAVV